MKNLYAIAQMGLKGFVNNYQNERRSWWDNVNEEDIYSAISQPEHAAYVEQVLEDAAPRHLSEAV